MRKAVSISFLFLYLTTFAPFREVLKLPILIEHFIEHRSADRSISFLAFLDMHYMHGSPKDADYDRDMQLPFKIISNVSGVAVVIPSSRIAFEAEHTLRSKEEKCPLINSSDYSFNYQDMIWQPPKVC